MRLSVIQSRRRQPASDADADAIEIDGVVHRRVLKSAETYMTATGAVGGAGDSGGGGG